MKKRVISWLLCLALCLSMLPMAALAEDVQAPEGPAPNQGSGEAAGRRDFSRRTPDAARLRSVIGWRQPFCGPCFRTKTRLQPVCNAYKRQAGFWLDDNLPGNGSSPSSPC